MKKLTILGSTGSIGRSTLEVVSQFSDDFQVIGLGAGRNIQLLREQIKTYKPNIVSVLNESLAKKLKKEINKPSNIEIVWGTEGYRKIATHPDVNMVVSAIVGGAGFIPTLAAIEASKDIALANKETLVMGGQIVTKLAKEKHIRLLPVDSEHSAIFQALQGNNRTELRKILLTASGGPFRKLKKTDLRNVTPEQALLHPTWSMGSKITIDSATLMNKGLEVIEACWLFDVEPSQIEVHIHPESIIHSMVEYIDGSIIAQLGIPDMKIPIAYALTYPKRFPLENSPLDLFAIGKLTFYKPDPDKFRCLKLAYDALEVGGTMPAVLNAANEMAVGAFLQRRISFPEIPETIEETMSLHKRQNGDEVTEIISADNWARKTATKLIER